MPEKKSFSRPMGIAIIALLAVLIAIGAVLVYLLLRPREVVAEHPPRTHIRGTVVTPENVDEIRERLARPREDTHFTANMNMEWEFERWNAPSTNAHVENDTLNTRTIYFDLILDETGELLFSSPFIPVGAVIDQVTLNRRLSAGVHPATVVYHLVDDDYNEVASASFMVLLRILQ